LSDPDNPAALLVGVVGSLTSAREQREKGRRTMRGKLNAALEGTYQGGNVPFAFDVAVYGPDGKERWRVVIDGRATVEVDGKKERGGLLRRKVWADGRQEHFHGKGHAPKCDRHDTPRLAWSCVAGRVEAARAAFEMYAGEDLSLWAVAKRLNEMSVKPTYGNAWSARMIESLLSNPVYVGVPVLGRDQQGDFSSFQLDAGGRAEVVDVPWRKNRPVHGRTRPPDQWVKPTTFRLTPIVSAETWRKVQEKLARQGTRSQPARNDVNWLKPLMTCGCCGKGMRAIDNQSGRAGRQYFCGTWQDGLRGAPNPSGCRRHPVDHELAEAIIARYLQEKHEGYSLLAAAGPATDLPHLEGDLEAKRREIKAVHEKMAGFIRNVLAANPCPFLEELRARAEAAADGKARTWEAREGDCQLRFGVDHLADLYDIFHGVTQGDLDDRIALLEEDLKKQVLAFLELPGDNARKIANQHIAKLEAQLEELKARREPLLDKLEALQLEVATIKCRLGAAREALAGSNNRRKAAALAEVVERIVCRFRHQEGGGRRPSSVLDEVEIIPRAGEPVKYPAGLFEGRVVDPPPQKKQGVLS
jgi:hypothetical protein